MKFGGSNFGMAIFNRCILPCETSRSQIGTMVYCLLHMYYNLLNNLYMASDMSSNISDTIVRLFSHTACRGKVCVVFSMPPVGLVVLGAGGGGGYSRAPERGEGEKRTILVELF